MAVTRLGAAREEARAAVAKLGAEERSKLDAAMAVTFSEHGAYQDVQARAFAAGWIPANVAGFLYASLGEIGSADNGGWAAGTTLGDKVVATQAIAQLLDAELKLRGASSVAR